MGIFLAQRLTDGHGDLARTLGKEGGGSVLYPHNQRMMRWISVEASACQRADTNGAMKLASGFTWRQRRGVLSIRRRQVVSWTGGNSELQPRDTYGRANV
jgi:hypothetical protein